MTTKRIISPGAQFGPWTVLKWESGAWSCRHKQGQTARLTTSELHRADQDEAGPRDLSGAVFGDLTVLDYAGDRLWRCRCSCGRQVDKRGDRLLNGQSSVCDPAHHPSRRQRRPAEYAIWCAMKQRTTNANHPAYASYGGRGITVCPAWAESFDAFLSDVGPRPAPDCTLDRADDARGYEPGNVRWSSPADESTNRRPGRRAKLIEHDGQVMSVARWAKHVGLPRSVLAARLRNGWSVRDALTRPLVKTRPRHDGSFRL